MEPVALEVDMAAMADRQEGIAHRRQQSRLGGDLVAGAHVGKLVAAPGPVCGGRVFGSRAFGGEVIDEEQPVLVWQTRRQVAAFWVESGVHGRVASVSNTAPRGDDQTVITSTGEPVSYDGFDGHPRRAYERHYWSQFGIIRR